MTIVGKGNYSQVVFLDTNAVHLAKLMLSFAVTKSVDVQSAAWTVISDTLVNAGLKHVLKSYEQGYWILRYLIHQTNESAEIYYSPITRLELLCGSLRGEAIKSAANSGVPNRWYSRLDEVEIRQRLEPDRYEEVCKEFQDYESQFSSAGIEINEQPVNAEIWHAARRMLETIFVDVQDCLVYAGAFVQQADEIISIDEYLRSIAMFTENPGSAPEDLKDRFQNVKDGLADWYSGYQGWKMEDVKFPKVKKWRDMKKQLEVGVS